MKAIAVFALCVLLAGCGGGGGGGSAETRDASADGLWSGTGTEGGVTYDLQGLIYDNTLYSFSNQGGTMHYGKVFVSGNALSGSVETFEINGPSLGTSAISGTVSERQTISGQSANGSTFALTYDNAFDRTASLSKVAGIWSYTEGVYTFTITIQNDGTFDGSDTTGCQHLGSFSVPDPSHNIYRATLNVSNCGAANGAAAGHAVLGDWNATDDALIYGFKSANYLAIGPLFRQ